MPQDIKVWFSRAFDSKHNGSQIDCSKGLCRILSLKNSQYDLKRLSNFRPIQKQLVQYIINGILRPQSIACPTVHATHVDNWSGLIRSGSIRIVVVAIVETTCFHLTHSHAHSHAHAHAHAHSLAHAHRARTHSLTYIHTSTPPPDTWHSPRATRHLHVHRPKWGWGLSRELEY